MADPNYYPGGDILQQLGPDGLAAMMGMGGMEAQDQDLQQQIAQANALRGTAGPQRTGAAAGALQGLADMLRAYKGKQQEQKLRGERQQLLGDMTKQRTLMAQRLFPSQPQQPPQMALEPEVNIPELLRRPE